ncbi:type I-B CRISPR-associated endonuclease Cas1b [Candidatus Micrarchaeota archaeon]|nr:type I-B CRISPR-associated endonuclease Cas1b [Candidatus Micrarchaeota archaeon]
MMRDIYITKSGTLKQDENTLLFDTEVETIRIPVKEVSSIHLLNETRLNSRLLQFLSKNHIPAYFYNYYGGYVGCFAPREEYLSGRIIVNQVLHYHSHQSRLYIAREMVGGAVHNIRKTLMQYDTDSARIDAVLEKCSCATSIENLMGYEGNARAEYYSKFNHILKEEFFKMEHRKFNPPPDPINALLSFGNSMLYNTVLSQIFRTTLDPRVSFVHEPFERRYSLNLDIADIFKPLISDRVIFTLINKRMLSAEDFREETGYCFLSDIGRKKFIQAYDEKLNQTIKHPTLKRNVSYRHLIRIECYKLIKHILEETTYQSFRIYW